MVSTLLRKKRETVDVRDRATNGRGEEWPADGERPGRSDMTLVREDAPVVVIFIKRRNWEKTRSAKTSE